MMVRAGPPVTALQAARLAAGHTQASLIHALTRRARELNVPIATRGSLQTMVSRWENGHDTVTDPGYRRLLREILGRTNDELGFPDDPIDETAAELHERIIVARTVDSETIALFHQQVNTFRHLDRQFGAATLLYQLTAHVQQVERLVTYSSDTDRRRTLAAVLADAATLAGWESLDRTAVATAWRLHETAKAAAYQADAPHLLAYATAQQAMILLDIAEPDAALEQLDHACQLAAGAATPALMRAWLAAAHGEGLAAIGDRDGALRAFDSAATLLTREHDYAELPFIMLDEHHLVRWRGNALTRLGDPDSIATLEHALERITANTARASAVLLTDLAYAYAAAGDRTAAVSYATRARRIATQIGSDRQRRRLSNLALPQ